MSCWMLWVLQTTVQQWRWSKEKHRAVRALTLPQGHPRFLETAVSVELNQLVCKTPSVFASRNLDYLAIMHGGQSISIPTIQRKLVELGLHQKYLGKIALQHYEALHTDSAWLDHIIQNYMAEQIIFVDSESSKYGRPIAGQYEHNIGKFQKISTETRRERRSSITPYSKASAV